MIAVATPISKSERRTRACMNAGSPKGSSSEEHGLLMDLMFFGGRKDLSEMTGLIEFETK
jgi:hypothetical protein